MYVWKIIWFCLWWTRGFMCGCARRRREGLRAIIECLEETIQRALKIFLVPLRALLQLVYSSWYSPPSTLPLLSLLDFLGNILPFWWGFPELFSEPADLSPPNREINQFIQLPLVHWFYFVQLNPIAPQKHWNHLLPAAENRILGSMLPFIRNCLAAV